MECKNGKIWRVKYWETIADNLSKAGFSWGIITSMDSEWRDIVVVDARRDGETFHCARG